MKRLEELCISPAPWTYHDNCLRTAIPTFTVRTPYGVLANNAFEEDARFIVAMPKLYEASYDVVAYCEKNHLVPSEQFRPVLARLRAALAEAAGEEVSDAT